MRTKDFDVFLFNIIFDYFSFLLFFFNPDDPLELNPDPVARTFYRADPYEGRSWTKCSTRRFVMAFRRSVVTRHVVSSFRHVVMAFRRFGTPILLGRFGELPV